MGAYLRLGTKLIIYVEAYLRLGIKLIIKFYGEKV